MILNLAVAVLDHPRTFVRHYKRQLHDMVQLITAFVLLLGLEPIVHH